MVVTRAALIEGRFERMVAEAAPDLTIMTAEERARSITATLAARPEATADGGAWVFGYGSLIWNPAFHYRVRETGTIHGFHRRFCLWTPAGRGTPECPGLVLGLDRGGSCRGVVFRLTAEQAATELDIIWRREMVAHTYRPRWVRVQRPASPAVHAISFVVDQGHDRYAGNLDESHAAHTLARAEGAFGSAADYLFSTVDHLRELGLRDHGLERLRRRVAALKAGE